MKAILRSLLIFFLCTSSWMSVQAQTGACGIYDVIVQNIRTTNSGTGCLVTFDAAFSLQANNGNKFIFIQTYILGPAGTPNRYPNNFQCSNGTSTIRQTPTANNIGSPLLNLVIDNNNLAVGQEPRLLNTYTPDTRVSVVPNPPTGTVDSFLLLNGDTRITLRGITIQTPFPCGTQPITLVSDVFATNSAAANTANCVFCDIRYSAGFLNIEGGARCPTLGQYNIKLTNIPGTPISGTYNIYADNGNGILTTEGGSDVLVNPTPIPFTVAGGVGATATLTGSIPTNLQGRDLFIVLTQGTGSAAPGAQRVVLLPTINCSPLPVTFSSFSVSRNGRNVNLKWETTTEENNKGFSIQRNSGRGWADVGYVPSKANGGNSNAKLSYDFVDPNSERVVTQYRLRQEDLDGKFKVSEIRTVRGEAQESRVVVYPNPSNDGSINVLFDDARGNRDLVLSDMNGRVVKQFRSVTTNNLRMDNLTPGVYSLRIVNQSNGKATIEKVVINR